MCGVWVEGGGTRVGWIQGKKDAVNAFKRGFVSTLTHGGNQGLKTRAKVVSGTVPKLFGFLGGGRLELGGRFRLELDHIFQLEFRAKHGESFHMYAHDHYARQHDAHDHDIDNGTDHFRIDVNALGVEVGAHEGHFQRRQHRHLAPDPNPAPALARGQNQRD